MKAFPLEDRTKSTKDLDLSGAPTAMQRSLGMCWEMATDTFTSAMLAGEKPFTRRGVLSTVNSLFDPLGLEHYLRNSPVTFLIGMLHSQKRSVVNGRPGAIHSRS